MKERELQGIFLEAHQPLLKVFFQELSKTGNLQIVFLKTEAKQFIKNTDLTALFYI